MSPSTPEEGIRAPHLRSAAPAILGAGLLLLGWQLVAGRQPEILVPSPAETVGALAGLAGDGELTEQLAVTLRRAALGVAVALVLGAAWGLLAASRRWVDGLTRPGRGVLLGLPPVVPVVLGTVWLDDPGTVAVLVVVIVTLPTAAVTVAEGARGIDADLLELARVYRFSPLSRLRHVVAPALAPALRSAGSLCCSSGLRVTIMAELLVAPDGVGSAVAQARGTLETGEVFAWALVAVAAAVFTDRLVARPRRRTHPRAPRGVAVLLGVRA